MILEKDIARFILKNYSKVLLKCEACDGYEDENFRVSLIDIISDVQFGQSSGDFIFKVTDVSRSDHMCKLKVCYYL